MVCVDYGDLLEITLPYNRHHFSEVMVVTAYKDERTIACAHQNNAWVHATNAFYTDGAVFNKFRALEEGLDIFGKFDWMCIMDADILWPKEIDWSFLHTDPCCFYSDLDPGILYTPLRRMCEDLSMGVPQEPYWKSYPLHPQQVEWAGYTQIFHADDPHLPAGEWHQTDWSHAGGPDSFFQQRWPACNKLRPPFECLHLGRAGTNWCGRVTPYLDGSTHPNSYVHHTNLRNFMRQRQQTRSFDSEKIQKNS